MTRQNAKEGESPTQPVRKIDKGRPIISETSDKSPLRERTQQLQKIVFGQPRAVEQVAKALVRAESGMREPKLPIGVFLFLGPTGVGKTEMAKAIAHVLFEDPEAEKNFLRVDMTEFAEPHSIAKLIGSPPGYVGYNEQPRIKHAWANRAGPKILLLDEVEKAHPDVLKLFLPAMAEGMYSARNGTQGDQAVRFHDVLIILTSNAGSSAMQELRDHRPIGFKGVAQENDKSEAAISKAAEKALSHHFPPEFLRRMNQVVFHHLDESHYHLILEKFLARRNMLNTSNNHPKISLSQDARAYLVKMASEHKNMGGSAVAHVFEDQIVARVAGYLLEGSIQADEIARFELENNELTPYALPNTELKKKLAAAPAAVRKPISRTNMDGGLSLLRNAANGGEGLDPNTLFLPPGKLRGKGHR